MITSTRNGHVQALRALRRRRERLARGWYLAEGVRLLEETIRAGVIPALVLFNPSALEGSARGAALLRQIQALDTAVYPATDAVIAAASDTPAPQGVVAALPLPAPGAPDPAASVLVLDGLRDPGNLGAILRTAWAAGVTEVATTPGTADPFGPKAVRAGMGAHFNLGLHTEQTWDQIAAGAAGRPVFLAAAPGDLRYDAVDWRRPSLLILSSEAHGATRGADQLATARVYIPMSAGVDSLNVAAAAAVLLFEARRQRPG